MKSWNTPDHQIADTEHSALTFHDGKVLVLADWQVTEDAPDTDGRVWARLRGWVANTTGTGVFGDRYIQPVEAGPAQLVRAELRGRAPLDGLPVHVALEAVGRPHPNTWDHPGYLCTVSWLARRVDQDGRPVPETEVGLTRWTDPATGREHDLTVAHLPEGTAYNPQGFTWQHFGRWHQGVPLLHPVWGDHRTPAHGLRDGRPITDGRWVPAAEAPAAALAR